MGTEIARLMPSGDLKLIGEINERLPVIQNGLVNYYPFDSNAGCMDIIGGENAAHTALHKVNLMEACNLDWRDPKNWSSWFSADTPSVVWDPIEDGLKITGAIGLRFNQFFSVSTDKNFYIEFTAKNPTGTLSTYRLYAGTTSYDINKIALPGKPGSQDYFVAQGSYLNPGETYFKNNFINGAPRELADTITTNTTTWYSGTKYAKLILLCNYNNTLGSTEVTFIKDIKMYYDEPLGITIADNKGVAFGTHVNLCTEDQRLFKTANGFQGASLTVTQNQCIPETEDMQAVKIFTIGGTHPLKTYIDLGTPANGLVTTTSVFVKNEGAFPVKVSTNRASSEYINPGSSKYVVLTYTGDGVTTTYLGFMVADAAHTIQIVISQVQSIKLPYFVNFAKETYVNNLKIPFVFNKTMTIHFEHTGCMSSANSTATITAERLIQIGTFNTNNSIYINRRSDLPDTFCIYTKDNTGAWSSVTTAPAAFVTFSDFEYLKRNSYTIVLSGVTGWDILKLYINGVLKNTFILPVPIILATTTELKAIEFALTNATPISHALYHNYSIYNRELSDTEIMQLIKNKLTAHPTSNQVLGQSITEGLVLPSDSYHFPLEIDLYTKNKSAMAIRIKSAHFENGKLWIGNGVPDIITNYNFSNGIVGWNFWGNTGCDATLEENTDRKYIYGTQLKSARVKVTATSTCKFIIFQRPAIEAVDVISLSCICCLSDFSPVTNAKVHPEWNGRSGGINNLEFTSIERIPGTYFYICKAEGIKMDGTDDLIGVNTAIGVTCYFSSIRVEKRMAVTPANKNTTSVDIQFALVSAPYNLVWAGSWTIMYKKIPVLTSSLVDQTGKSTEGINGNISWGKAASVNALTTGETFTPEEYFNKTQWVVLRGVNNLVNIDFYLSNGRVINTTVTMGAQLAGYDLNLGKTSENSVPCAWYQDLIIVKRRLTDDEINTIIRQKINMTSDALNVSEIFESEVLI